jgi:hypothetical protein
MDLAGVTNSSKHTNPCFSFYEGLGFDPSPLDPMTLMITLADLRASLVVASR